MVTKLKREDPSIAAEWLWLYTGEDGNDADGSLAGYSQRLAAARQQVIAIERSRRHDAVVALRYGAEKTDVARLLEISRPTLDAWIEMVYANPDELAEVERTLGDQRRRVERERAKAAS